MEVKIVEANDNIAKVIGRKLIEHGYVLGNGVDGTRISEPYENTSSIEIMIEAEKNQRWPRRTRATRISTLNLDWLPIYGEAMKKSWGLKVCGKKYLAHLLPIIESLAETYGIEELKVHITGEPPRRELFEGEAYGM